jgi:hypothetical protein
MNKQYLLLLLLIIGLTAAGQPLRLKRADGLTVTVINPAYPLLKVLLPGEPESDRGIEIEFPEHLTGLNLQGHQVEHLYLVSLGTNNRRTPPSWHRTDHTLTYESDLDNAVTLTATVTLEEDGLRYTYKMINHGKRAWQQLQAVTCVKQYSLFADTLLERTYVHYLHGFELLASGTPQRLTMGLQKWLPCRYLVSYTWPVNPIPVQKDEDGVTRYHVSKKVDRPFLATLSHDHKWLAATYTREMGNLWTNPERSCQHADPAVNLGPGETKTLELKTFIMKGSLDQLLALVDREMKTR